MKISTSLDEQEAFDDGQDARDAGQTLAANPHPDDVLGDAWFDGWMTRDAEISIGTAPEQEGK